jgi:hypothetical protein
MLQRIQTLYFLLAAILIALPLFGVSIFSFKLGNLTQYVTVFGSVGKDQVVQIAFYFYANLCCGNIHVQKQIDTNAHRVDFTFPYIGNHRLDVAWCKINHANGRKSSMWRLYRISSIAFGILCVVCLGLGFYLSRDSLG